MSATKNLVNNTIRNLEGKKPGCRKSMRETYRFMRRENVYTRAEAREYCMWLMGYSSREFKVI